MSTAAKPKPELVFDDAKLQEMSEPITIHFERQVGGRVIPMTHILPIKEGQTTAGMGWSKDDVKNLTAHLIAHVEPGHYMIQATDDSGRKMRWPVYLPVTHKMSTEVVPPAPATVGVQSFPTPQQPIGVPMSQPSWLNVPQQYPPVGVPGGYTGGYVGGLPPSPAAFAPQLANVTPLRAVTEPDQLRQEREERIKLENRLERERMENAHKESLAGVKGEVRQLVDSMRTQATESSSERQLREQLAAQQRAAEQAQVAAMLERQRQDTMQLVTAIQQSTKDQLAAVQAQIQAIATAVAQKPAGPDPVMMMMIETMKLNQTAQQQQAAQQMQMFTHFMTMQSESRRNEMGPREWIELTKNSNQTAEQQAAAFGKAFELMMTGVETILQAQGPQMHPALEMIGQGIQGAVGIGQKAMENREHQINTQAAIAQHQANAQLQLAREMAAQRAATPALVAPPPPPEAEGDEEDDDEGDDAEGEATEPSDNVVAIGSISPEAQAERRKHEKQLFGSPVVIEGVRRLRAGVRSGVLDSQKAAIAIAQGVGEFHAQGLQVPLMQLWIEGRLAEVVDALLPEAKDSFRARVVEQLVALKNHVQHQAAQQHAAAAGAQPPPPKKQRRAAEPAPAS